VSHWDGDGYVLASERVVDFCLRRGLIAPDVRRVLHPLDVAPKWLVTVVPLLGPHAHQSAAGLRQLAVVDQRWRQALCATLALCEGVTPDMAHRVLHDVLVQATGRGL